MPHGTGEVRLRGPGNALPTHVVLAEASVLDHGASRYRTPRRGTVPVRAGGLRGRRPFSPGFQPLGSPAYPSASHARPEPPAREVRRQFVTRVRRVSAATKSGIASACPLSTWRSGPAVLSKQ